MRKPARTDPAFPRYPGGHGVVRVWDPVVRGFHWCLAASFAVAWFTPQAAEAVHHIAGYAAGALVFLRLLWGFLGTPYARFSQFVRHPATILAYLAAIATGREARHIGHNPAGGAMVVVLLVTMAATAVSGYLMTTDRYWGVAWVETAHWTFAHGLLVLVAAHLCGVGLASARHRENLVAAMISGVKRAPDDGDVA